ncbi:hypothetical protein AX16_005837 [Volvariella volvacea WC 439]|nr:hypothetical protein AX16_005837 [Volvariella volvacea WC 439]
MSTHTIQALRDQIDAQLATLSLPEEERVLKSRRNQLAPISVLPAEVLAKIIRLTILEYDREKERNQSTYRQHVIIASVCQSWRAVIIGDRMLWTKVEWPYLPFVPLLLERSGMAPLSIDFSALPILLNGKGGWPKKLTRDALNLIAQHHHRIQELAMDFETFEDERCRLEWDPLFHVEEPPVNFTTWLVSTLPLKGCTYLRSRIWFTQEEWQVCADSIPDLEELNIAPGRAGQQNLQMFFDLIDVLIPHNSQTPLPKLTHLIIEYRATEEGCERLINMMRLRKDAGCDLEYVAIGMVQTLAVGRKAEIEEDMKQIVKEVEVVEL